MAKIIITCPDCNSDIYVSTFSKTAKCDHCGKIVNVKRERMAKIECPHCGKTGLYKFGLENIKCSNCKKTFSANESANDVFNKRVQILCPKCNMSISVRLNGNSEQYADCPGCGTHIDVKREIAINSQYDPNSISVIKYEGDSNFLSYKHTIEKINMGSQLIVGPSQEAVFVLGGQPLDLFGPGTHTLNTENIPMLVGMNALPPDGQTPFLSKVYFFNTSCIRGIKWGIGGITYRDANMGNIPFQIGLSGELSLQIANSRQILKEFGTNADNLRTMDLFNPDVDELRKYGIDPIKNPPKKILLNRIQPIIKQNFSRLIMDNKLDIVVIENNLVEFGEIISKLIATEFEKFGLTLVDFAVSKIQLPENDDTFQKYLQRRREAFNIQEDTDLGIVTMKAQDKLNEVAATSARNQIQRQNDLNVAGVSGEATVNAIRASAELANKTEAEMTELQLENARRMMEADAEIYKQGAEADIEIHKELGHAQAMREMNYDGKDVLGAEVDIARAEAIGKVGSRVGGPSMGGGFYGSGGNGGTFNNLGGMIMDWQIGKAVGKNVAKEVNNVMNESDDERQNSFKKTENKSKDDSWKCECGAENTGNFCSECGKTKPQKWKCECGAENTGKFCSECGKSKPQRWKCECGAENTGKFCSECGKSKPQKWKCECGAENTGKFCNECGKEKQSEKEQ